MSELIYECLGLSPRICKELSRLGATIAQPKQKKAPSEPDIALGIQTILFGVSWPDVTYSYDPPDDYEPDPKFEDPSQLPYFVQHLHFWPIEQVNPIEYEWISALHGLRVEEFAIDAVWNGFLCLDDEKTDPTVYWLDRDDVDDTDGAYKIALSYFLSKLEVDDPD